MFGSPLVAELLLTSTMVFLLAVSLLGLLIGAGLVLRSTPILRFMRWSNRWISTRQTLQSLEAPLQLAPRAAGTRWFGAVLVALGAYTTAILISAIDVNGIAAMLQIDARYSLSAIGLHAAKWILVLGGFLAVITGIMLLFFPRAWRGVEARANRWYSTGSLEHSEDTLYLSLDRAVEAFPRASGVLILVLSLATAIGAGMLILR